MLGISSCTTKDDKGIAQELMKKNKYVRIGTDPVNLPFEFGKGTEVQGLDVDIGNEIAKDLNYEAKWLKIAGYEHLYEVLGLGDVEMLVSTLAIDPKRQDKFAFSQPYYEGEDAIASRLDNRLDDLSSLSGKKVAVAEGRPGATFMAGRKDVILVKFPTLDHALGALNRAEVDAVVGDRQVLTYSTFKSFLNVTVSPASINKYQYAVAVRKEETKLLESVNRTLDRLKSSGKLTELNKTWYLDVEEEAKKNRGKYLAEEEMKKSPKSIAVTIIKTPESRWQFNMDRLDGFELVLEGSAGRFKSTPIYTDGNRGTCRFTSAVPVGTYKLDMRSIFQTTATVEVQPLAKKSFAMTINIARDINIIIK